MWGLKISWLCDVHQHSNWVSGKWGKTAQKIYNQINYISKIVLNYLSISACNVGTNTWPIESSTGQDDVEIFFGEFWGKFNPNDFTNDHNKYQL